VSAKKAVIIGGGPAGLTVAYELLKRTDIQPLIFEAGYEVGGLSKTLTYAGNRLDIGPHRFFSKSERVVHWWEEMLPSEISLLERGIDVRATDKVMLLCSRLTRILHSGHLFPYPLSLDLDTLSKLGLWRVLRIGSSYLHSCVSPGHHKESLEDFFIERFGRELYLIFFKDYTEKVWGVPCREISADWGVQRIKGLSITKALLSALRHRIMKNRSTSSVTAETSLIRSFLYPKLGAGQMWQQVCDSVVRAGASVCLGHRVIGVTCDTQTVVGLKILEESSRTVVSVDADYVFSTMPIKDFIAAMGERVPSGIREVSNGLPYRDHILVGLLARRMNVPAGQLTNDFPPRLPDKWIYIQDPAVKMGRVEIFNNWSPAMVADADTVWLGIEYFCQREDDLWSWADAKIIRLAADELIATNLVKDDDILTGVVVRTPQAYPAYFGTYDRLDQIREYIGQFENLFTVGRNGMHRYNNMDHSVLSAMVAVDTLIRGGKKDSIWMVNTEKSYHESKN
jgi:protoporphyrinogen oxidase